MRGSAPSGVLHITAPRASFRTRSAKEARRQQVRRDRHPPGSPRQHRAEPLPRAGDVADGHRPVEAFGEHRGGRRAVAQGLCVGRAGGRQYHPIHPPQVFQPIHQDVDQQRVRAEGRRAGHDAGPPRGHPGDVHCHVIPAAQQQRHHDRLLADRNNPLHQLGQRRYVDIHEAKGDRHSRPLPGDLPHQCVDLADATKVRSSVSRSNQVRGHPDNPALSTGSTDGSTTANR